MYVCMHACMYVCVYECMCMYVCIHVCMYILYICIYAYAYVCMYTIMYACVRVCTNLRKTPFVCVAFLLLIRKDILACIFIHICSTFMHLSLCIAEASDEEHGGNILSTPCIHSRFSSWKSAWTHTHVLSNKYGASFLKWFILCTDTYMQDWAQTKTLVDIKMLASELAEKETEPS